MREAINETLDWGWQVGILSLGTKEKQVDKVVEEALELKEAINTGNISDIEFELGDSLITNILLANMCGLDIARCIRKAIHKNINRPKGEMLDGEYVREKK